LLGALLMATVGAVKELPSFYHTTSSINDELSNIANRCSNFISLVPLLLVTISPMRLSRLSSRKSTSTREWAVRNVLTCSSVSIHAS
jgi:hypothetical protein